MITSIFVAISLFLIGKPSKRIVIYTKLNFRFAFEVIGYVSVVLSKLRSVHTYDSSISALISFLFLIDFLFFYIINDFLNIFD